MKLSLCVATYNEEKNLHYPLDSALDLVDEAIIVDGGSTDKTVEVAKSYGKKIKVYRENFERMFHKNKQKAIERASGEWILQLDADEALSDELKEEIKIIINDGQKHTSEVLHSKSSNPTSEVVRAAYWIPRKNFFLTRFLTKGGQYPDYTIRLYRNGAVRFPCKSVHENVELIRNSQSAIGYLNNPILHYADPNFSRYLRRWDRYTTAEADQLIREKKSIGFIDYCFVKPVFWFLSVYFRHKGFVDGFAGFVFAFFSALRFIPIYIKWKQGKK